MAREEGGFAKKLNNSLKDWQGVNTQAARESIGDEQFAWLENVQPIGFANMPAIPAQSAVLVTWTGTATQMKSVNLNGVDYELVFTALGSAYAVNLTSFVATLIAIAGTFSASGVSVAQWENAQAIIVDPTKGYFTFDGVTLTKQNGTLQSVTVTTIGINYTSSPTISGFGTGGGSGGAVSVGISVGAFTAIPAAGSGYIVGDVLTAVGGTFTTAATFRVASVNGTGGVTGLNLVGVGNYTSSPGNPVSVTGGYGTGMTLTLNFGIGPVTLTSAGSGYTSAPTLTVTGGGGTGGTVTANLVAVPSGGTAVATYAGRVWVASGRTVVYSGPTSFTDFTPASAGGSFIVVDETLHSTITQLLSANNFLYIFGTSSVNVVADVTISGGVTIFSNTNISANIGTNQPDSVTTYYRAAWFGAPYGLYALYGSTTQKASDDLDGLFSLLDQTFPLTVGTAVLNKILCLCYLVKYNDPVLGPRPLLAIFFNKKWFFASQGNTLTRLDSTIISGTPTLFATDGTSLYRLFSDTSASVSQTIITKLWDMGKTLQNKQAIRFGLEIINPSTPQTITGTIDTENPSKTYPINLVGGNVVQWTNNAGQTVQWVNNSGQIVSWLGSGYSFQEENVSTSGHYLGVTLNGTSAGTTYQGIHLQYIDRAAWGNP